MALDFGSTLWSDPSSLKSVAELPLPFPFGEKVICLLVHLLAW